MLAVKFITLCSFFISSLQLWGRDTAKPKSQSQLINKLIKLAKHKQLSTSREWRKILFIPDQFFPNDTSLIDSKSFFISHKGKSSPQKELFATIKMLIKEEKVTINGKLYPGKCAFPARLSFLEKHLKLQTKANIKMASCKKLKQYLSFTNYTKISLVFANYYMNNPASMFGHTLIRLHRDYNNSPLTISGQLDETVNFAAMLPPHPDALYPLKGLLGWFPGKFSILPYYQKIQEYNNFESRDLWEYELSFSRNEINKMMLILWEQSFNHANYYYFDENCSYILLLLFEAVRPQLKLTEKIPLYTIPIDTVKTIVRSGLSRNVNFKPSSLARYLEYAKRLAPKEKSTLSQIFANHNDNIGKFTNSECSEECSAKILDAGIELIDFKESIGGNKKAVEYASMRHQLLNYRSQTNITSPPLKSHPSYTSPDKGHDSGLLASGLGFTSLKKDSGYGILKWRPAFHDIAASSTGYSDNMHILFMDTEVQYNLQTSNAFLSKFTLLEILSLAPSYLLISPISWALHLGYKQTYACPLDNISCTKINFFGSAGKNIDLMSNKIKLYLLAGPSFDAFITPNNLMTYSLRIKSGAITHLSHDIKLLTELNWIKDLSSKITGYTQLHYTVAYHGGTQWEARAISTKEGSIWNNQIMFIKYF